MEKQLERQKKAREEKDRVKTIKERGTALKESNSYPKPRGSQSPKGKGNLTERQSSYYTGKY